MHSYTFILPFYCVSRRMRLRMVINVGKRKFSLFPKQILVYMVDEIPFLCHRFRKPPEFDLFCRPQVNDKSLFHFFSTSNSVHKMSFYGAFSNVSVLIREDGRLNQTKVRIVMREGEGKFVATSGVGT